MPAWLAPSSRGIRRIRWRDDSQSVHAGFPIVGILTDLEKINEIFQVPFRRRLVELLRRQRFRWARPPHLHPDGAAIYGW